MKAVFSMMLLVAGLACLCPQAQAQDSFLPRGGWDGNNLRISATQSKLMEQQTSIRGGGWDFNNCRVSANQSKLLPQTNTSIGGWDRNNCRISVNYGKLIDTQK